MNFVDRLRASVTAFREPVKSEQDRRSLSAQRAWEKYAQAYLGGTLGRRIANDDPLLAQHGGGNIELWRDIHDDERCFSCFQQRRLAVISRPWEVEAGGPDRKSKKAAEFLRYTINRVGWDRVCDRMLFGRWYGYAVAEAVYRIEPEGDWAGLVGLERIDVPDRAWFGFDIEGRLRILDPLGIRDQEVPERKFWYFSAGGDHDFVSYGIGLAHWLFWPVFFKRQGLPFWLRFLERFGSPTVKGEVSEGHLDTPEGRSKVMSILTELTGNSAVAIPDWMKVDVLDAARTGAGGYEMLIDRMDAAITRVVLSQTMTTDAGPAGLGSGQANVHMDVREEITRSDSDLLHESFNRSIATWLTEFNFPGAKPPRVYRIMDDPDDLDTLADRDTTLEGLGWVRTEESFHEVFGEGYERKEVEEPPRPLVPGRAPPEFAATDPQPLYVSRKLLNAREFLAWAERQGFKTTLDADDLHVTVLYSRTPVNWFKMGSDFRDKVTVEAGGPRKVDQLRDEGAVVLHFGSSDLEWRHEEMVRRGASHDYDEYLCHVTISYDAGDVDLGKVEPYTGKLVFGPEIFEPIKENDGRSFALALAFTAADLDAIDRLVTAMGNAGNEALVEFLAPLKGRLEGVTNPEIARVAMLDFLETMEPQQLHEALATAGIAVRAAAEAGVDMGKLA